LKEKEEDEDGDEEGQAEREGKTRQDSELKKTRMEIPGLY
jgi:hypothetical protein